MTRQSAPGPRGLLNRKTRQNSGHTRHLPARELRAFVEHYWIVRWDLRGQAPHLAETLPHPSVHWITEGRRSAIQGVPTGLFSRVLTGRGRVFGVKFRPGGFYPFLGTPVSAFTDDSLSLGSVFGREGRAIGKALGALHAEALGVRDRQPGDKPEGDQSNIDERMMDLVERFLLARLPEPDPQLRIITEMVAAIVGGPDVTKVEAVAGRFGMSQRSLQRLFRQYVGVSPKWMIQRYRLHEAVERVAAGHRVSWSRLALDLGYFDQTHFIKDFKALVGKSPAEYARSLNGGVRTP